MRHRDRSKSSHRSNVPYAVVKYRRELSKKADAINQNYAAYDNHPESHPKYNDEWKEFWLRKYDEVKGEPNMAEITDEWRIFWIGRSMELQEDEILKLRVKLRDQMDLPIELADIEKLKKLERQEKEKKKNEEVTEKFSEKPAKVPKFFKLKDFEAEKPQPAKKKPIVDLNELSQAIPGKTEDSADKKKPENIVDDSGVSSNDEAIKTPVQQQQNSLEMQNKINDLTNSEIISLFGIYNDLSEVSQNNLTEYMNFLENSDPERFQFLTNSHVDIDQGENEEINEKFPETSSDARIEVLSDEIFHPPLTAASITAIATLPIPQISTNDDDEDDYPLENSDVVKRAVENAKIIEVDDSDSESLVEFVDLTED